MYHGSSTALRGPPPIDVTSPLALSNFGAHVREHYRAYFSAALAAGDLRPLVIPYSVFGAFILPVLYLAVPHTRRPWLYAARYLVMLAIVAFNMAEIFGGGGGGGGRRSSSANFAVGYAVGLMQAWGVLWSATLLLWMKPQFEAERVAKRKKRDAMAGKVEEEEVKGGGFIGNGVDCGGWNVNGNGNGKGVIQTGTNGAVRCRQSGQETTQQNQDGHLDSDTVDAPDEDVARSLAEGYEYYWQAYPADESFVTRLAWSLDLVMSFRGTGWNWCVPVIPHFARPEKPLSNSLVDLSSIPRCTRQGYCRYITKREWLRRKLIPMLLMYLALDALSTLMMKDPYFILGPDDLAAINRGKTPTDPTRVVLPRILAALPPSILTMYRASLCFLAILLAIDLIMSCYQLFEHSVTRPILDSVLRHNNSYTATTLELWRYPCVYGAFTHNVLDRGMAGFWGGWWHQTFRIAFSAPGLWLARHQNQSWTGLDPQHSLPSKMITGFLAFAQSGFLHSLGGITCLPPHTRPWLPPVFFLLCWVGAVVQSAACALLASILKSLQQQQQQKMNHRPPSPFPTWLRRTANLVFVFGWLLAIQHFLCDDFARAGVWLLEPVPVSPLRALGLGKPGDVWWRWDAVYWPRWYVGRHWWESGIAF